MAAVRTSVTILSVVHNIHRAVMALPVRSANVKRDILYKHLRPAACGQNPFMQCTIHGRNASSGEQGSSNRAGSLGHLPESLCNLLHLFFADHNVHFAALDFDRMLNLVLSRGHGMQEEEFHSL